MALPEARLAVPTPRSWASLLATALAVSAFAGPQAAVAPEASAVTPHALALGLPGFIDDLHHDGHPDARPWPHGMVIGTPSIDHAMVIRPPAIDPGILLRSGSSAMVTGIPVFDSVLSGLLGLTAWPGA